MKRLDRLTALITFLQSRKFVSAQQIQDKFSMSIRTVYRDIRALEEAGIPVGFEPNKGYFIVAGYYLPPVSFTNEEAFSIILAERLIQKFTDPQTYKTFTNATAKIRAVVSGQLKEELEAFEEKILSYIPPGWEGYNRYLAEAQQAIMKKEILEIEYLDRKGNNSQRKIEPIGLNFYSGNWHLIAYCHSREDYRDFIIAHIQSLQNLRKPFIKENHLTMTGYIAKLVEEEYLREEW
ncbi:MAG: YafY family transcriptional regulator [Bacteroidetes bacterium]|nr:YafY family transcriptional regulator [Bacteroidota bacterium]